MAANSKSGTSKQDRIAFLRENNWVPTDRGRGDHTVWEHPGFKELSRHSKITCPGNLLHNVAQLPWEHTVPDNPASGTWHRIAKHAEWCEETVKAHKATIQAAAETKAARHALLEQFHENRADLFAWRREMRLNYKSGHDMTKTRPAPVTWDEVNALRNQLKSGPK
jgi:hypothetical protein